MLIELAHSVKPSKVIVEIGTYRGRSTAALAFGSLMGSKNRVYAIDPHVEFQGVFGKQYGLSDQAILYANLTRLKIGEIVAVICLPSVNAARAWSEENIGLLLIDGDHRYEAVCDDFENWYPFVANSGIIAFHDNYAEGVKAVIEEIIAAKKVYYRGQVDMLSLFEKVSNDK